MSSKAKQLLNHVNFLYDLAKKTNALYEHTYSRGFELRELKYKSQTIQILDFLKELQKLDENLYNEKISNYCITFSRCFC